jgi:hypothetical protein
MYRTLEELLARVFFEEGVMLDRTIEIVQHEQEDRFDLIFGIPSVVREGRVLWCVSNLIMCRRKQLSYPFTPAKNHTSQEHGGSGDLAGRVF